jgi:hypothetical protein
MLLRKLSSICIRDPLVSETCDAGSIMTSLSVLHKPQMIYESRMHETGTEVL